MKTVSALELRQTFGKVLGQMKRSCEPLIIEKNSEPVAVLIPYEEFKRRFVDRISEGERDALVARFSNESFSVTENSTEILRQVRYGG